jgi:hypothetical protein
MVQLFLVVVVAVLVANWLGSALSIPGQRKA